MRRKGRSKVDEQLRSQGPSTDEHLGPTEFLRSEAAVHQTDVERVKMASLLSKADVSNSPSFRQPGSWWEGGEYPDNQLDDEQRT